MTSSRPAEHARTDWENRIGRHNARPAGGITAPPAPATVRATAGRGQVTLDWDPVPGAAGYLVHRADISDGDFQPVDHKGLDVLAVPDPSYVDTTGVPGRPYRYAVAALADVAAVGPLSHSVQATSDTGGDGRIGLDVDVSAVVGPLHRPWRPMVGSEHLSHLLSTEQTGGRPIGAELADALRIMRTELGVETVRAHGILCDDLRVYREVDGEPVYDFSGVDRVYDQVRDLGLRPVVELSFMPRDLASDRSKTVFTYGAIVSPPKDWDRWADLVRALVRHLLDRYGTEEVVEHWSFEVWNEANLEVFWSGGKSDYLRLYDVTAAAVREVDDRLVVAGPATAAAGWVEDLLSHVDGSGAALDALTTHTYGSQPLDFRPALARHDRADTRIWWTEWGVTPRHFAPVNDSVFAACFLARGMKSAAGRVDALAYWVCSDHFEELGRPTELLHGGFGLLTVGNLRKPRFHALSMLEKLGDGELALRWSGDGGGGLVDAWASIDQQTGRVAIAGWNAPLDQSKVDGDPLLDRTLTLTVTGLPHQTYELRHHRLDATHSNLAARWGSGWPTAQEWDRLRAADGLALGEPPRAISPAGGRLTVTCDLPEPSMVLLELLPG
ncbi:GH39 family glycosyl hydrolase [Fodinicola acaciae]|uniref:GH39 family glycosyl hydrolase n=1 Tax=Fodinicola acaciae TaxID=2681555 RepID=UPI0013D41AFE|nr:xylan 1,4-beta-xylosidase [Fodinicola acaciae]